VELYKDEANKAASFAAENNVLHATIRNENFLAAALISQEALAQAEVNLKVNEESFDNGMIDVSGLLEAQAMRQQALDQAADAAAGYRLKVVYCLQVTGR